MSDPAGPGHLTLREGLARRRSQRKGWPAAGVDSAAPPP